MSSKLRLHRLNKIIFEIVEHIKSIHSDETHWMKLNFFPEGIFFRTDIEKQILEFSLDVGVKVELEVHPSGRAVQDCDEVDCLAQEVSVRAWHSDVQDPYIYKWEYGSPTKLKKEDKDWYEDVDLLKSIEVVLEDVVKSMK